MGIFDYVNQLHGARTGGGSAGSVGAYAPKGVAAPSNAASSGGLSSLDTYRNALNGVQNGIGAAFGAAAGTGFGKAGVGVGAGGVGSLVDRIAAGIRQHESGGNYNALNGSEPADVAARGAYQFIPSTYASVNKMFGGDGSWSQANQDYVAKKYIASILGSSGNDPAAVAATWYVGHVPGSESEWNAVPYPSAGNTITVRAYANYLLDYLKNH